MPLGVIETLDEPITVSGVARQRFGVASSNFFQVLLQFRRILFQISNLLAGLVPGIAIDGDDDGAHCDFVGVVQPTDRRQCLSCSREEFLFTQVVKKGLF